MQAKGETPASKKILIVDDNVDAAESMAALLQVIGCEVRTSYSGSESLAAAEAFRPDVIFVDIFMPDLKGFEVAERIRRTSWGDGITICALTGYDQIEKGRWLEAGIDLHLVKPIKLEALRHVLVSA
jgi:CheY-like chemotaxis protein